jgi:glycerol kinase
LTAYATKAHIIRASLESTAFQTYEVLHAMQLDSNIKVNVLKVDGGMTVNNFAMQFLCDLLNTSLVVPNMNETTALGAAFIAGLGVGF